MFTRKLLFPIVTALLTLPLRAGTILNTYPDGPGAYTNVFILEAQTFTVPTDNILSSFEFKMFSAPGQTAQVQVYAWGLSGPTGPALYTSAVLPRINQVGQDFLISNINLTLTSAALYGAVINSAGYAGQNAAFNLNQNSYTGGAMWLVQQGTSTWSDYTGSQYNLTFQADFVNSVAGSSAPEPGSFFLIGGGLGAVAFLRRRAAKALVANP